MRGNENLNYYCYWEATAPIYFYRKAAAMLQ